VGIHLGLDPVEVRLRIQRTWMYERLGGDRSAGDDIAQTTLLKAYAAIVDGSSPTHLRPWLYRVAHNAALDLIARRREVPSAAVGDRPTPTRDPLAAHLITAVAALPERQRHVFVLRELHGLRIDETAFELGISAAQVEQALFAARNRLSELLVFGARLDCVSVRRLGRESLDVRERRALKAHLRSCEACRSDTGLRERARSAAVALAPLLWLRGLATGLAGSSAAAFKVGAVVATVGVAAGVPALRIETREARVTPLEPVTAHHDLGFAPTIDVSVRPARHVEHAASPPVHSAPAPAVTHAVPVSFVSHVASHRTVHAQEDHAARAEVSNRHHGTELEPTSTTTTATAPAGAEPPVLPPAEPAVQPVADGHDGGGSSSGPGSGIALTGHEDGGSGGSSGRDGSSGHGSGDSGGDDQPLDGTSDPE